MKILSYMTQKVFQLPTKILMKQMKRKERRGPDVGVRENTILGHCFSLAHQLITRKST